mgnify:CR=1 FL=1
MENVREEERIIQLKEKKRPLMLDEVGIDFLYVKHVKSGLLMCTHIRTYHMDITLGSMNDSCPS